MKRIRFNFKIILPQHKRSVINKEMDPSIKKQNKMMNNGK